MGICVNEARTTTVAMITERGPILGFAHQGTLDPLNQQQAAGVGRWSAARPC